MFTMLLIAALAAGATGQVTVAPGESLVVSDNVPGNVSATGDGPTVVLVPGLNGCAYGFRNVVPLLTDAGCRAVVIVPLGVGASTRPATSDYSLTAQADRLAAAMDQLGAGRSLVVGHGLAASMVLRLAYRRPDLVAGIVSIEGGADECAVTPGVKKALGLASFAVKLGVGGALRDRLRASLEAASGDKSWITKHTVRRYWAGMGRDLDGTLAALRAMAETTEPESLHENLGRVACPVTLLLGTAPHAAGPDAAAVATLESGLPDLHQIEFAGAGHYLHEEDPAGVAAAILEALAGERLAALATAAEGSTP